MMKIRTLWACLLLLVSASFALATSHKVRQGENDETIARKYGVSAAALRKANPKINWNRLRPGTTIDIPGDDKKKSTTKTKADNKRTTPQSKVSFPKPNATHKVLAGESDYSIARDYGLKPEQVRAMNPGTNFRPLRAGITIKVHKKSSTTSRTNGDRAAIPTASATKPSVSVRSSNTNANEISTINAEVSKDTVIVRSSPSTNGGRVTTVPKGTVARVVDRQGEWYRLVFAGGTAGWVRGDMLKNTEKQVTVIKSTVTSAPKKTPAPAPSRTASKSSMTATGKDLIDTAMGCIGIRYVWGGTSRRGFDCSGFVGYVFRQHGVNLPRTSAEQYRVGTSVARNSLRAGDLVFFITRGSRVSHVGIYIGNNRFIHASSGGGRIRINELTGYYAQRYAGAKRVSNKFAVSQEELDRYASTLPVEEPAFNVDPEPDPVGINTSGTDVIQD